MKKHHPFRHLYLGLVFLFLYAPIIVLIVFSFNAGTSRSVFAGFSIRWYEKLLKSDTLIQSFWNSIIVAVISSVIATVIGTYGALIIGKMKAKTRNLTINIINIPMINAEIVTGLSLMMLFAFVSIPLGFGTLLIAHVMFNVPYVILSVLPKVKQLKRSTYEAALDLGATPAYAFRKIIIPDLMPGIISGLLMSFTMSLDDFIISYFTTGPGFPTLSVTINSMTKKSVPLSVNALSAVMFVIVFVVLLLANLPRKGEKRNVQKNNKSGIDSGNGRRFGLHTFSLRKLSFKSKI